MSDNRQELGELIAAANVARVELARSHKLAEATLALVEMKAATLLEGAVEGPLQSPVEDLPALCEHRRAHRPGRPARIDVDRDLRAFILARIDRLTFDQLEDAVAEAFPPARRIGKSAIHAWWTKHSARRDPNSQPE